MGVERREGCEKRAKGKEWDREGEKEGGKNRGEETKQAMRGNGKVMWKPKEDDVNGWKWKEGSEGGGAN